MIKVNVGSVQLPRKSVFSGFKQEMREENGAMIVDFMPPLKLPIATTSLQQLNNEYRDLAQIYAMFHATSPKTTRYLAQVGRGDLADLVNAVFARTLPGFIGDGQHCLGYDHGDLSLKEFRINGERLQGWSSFEIRPEGGLYFTVDEFRFPVSELPKQKLNVPEITGVTVTEYVTLPNIRAENGGTFFGHLVEPILRALIYDAPLALEDSTFYYGKKAADLTIRRGGLNFETDRARYHFDPIYAQVAHPSLQMFNEAANEARSLEGFFEEHMPALREAVALVHEAALINGKKLLIIGEYRGLEYAHSEAVKQLGYLPPVGGITETTQSIDALIAAKLREADQILEPLRQHVPRGMMSYAAQSSLAA